MGRWRSWWYGVLLLSQQHPPQIIEGTMLLLAMVLTIAWFFLQSWQYLVLSLSYIVGTISSILVREWIAPSPQTQEIRTTALLSLLLLLAGVSFYLFSVTNLL